MSNANPSLITTSTRTTRQASSCSSLEHHNLAGWLFALPWTVIFLIFLAMPIIASFILSFTDFGFILLIVGLVFMIVPFIWMVLSSLKGQVELAQLPPTWIPVTPTLSNYSKLFTELNFPRYFLNSVILAVSITILNLIFCSMIGYALAKLKFAGKNALFLLVLATLMIPSAVTLVPLFVLMSKLQLVNTLTAVILPESAGALGVFLMRQFMLDIPKE
jgi:multiple sugar transport system permease protein